MAKELNIEDFENFQELAEKITEVHEELFPDATLETQCAKFEEEFEEFREARNDEEIKSELADLFIVACGIKRFNYGIFYILFRGLIEGIPDNHEFAEAVIAKMNKNIKRKWDNRNGLYKHTTLN
jgi:hypothetical protein